MNQTNPAIPAPAVVAYCERTGTLYFRVDHANGDSEVILCDGPVSVLPQ